jgi:predicted Rossmann fold flavoprotein
MRSFRIIVIGAGPAGLMAAGQAALLGADVLLLEKMNRPGLKLGITGKGRCNLTNIGALSDTIAHFGPNGSFLRQAFSRFFNSDLIAFFEDLGVPIVTERGGRVFPESGKAHDIVAALVKWNKSCGVTLKTRSQVESLLTEEGRVAGVRVKKFSRDKALDDKVYGARAIIITTGGASYPATGSTGDGYLLAQSVGHRLVPVRPALVPLETEGDTAKGLIGLGLKNVRIRLLIDEKRCAEAFGEMLFTGFGVSGPVILSLSRLAVNALMSGQTVALSIDLKPALDEARLDARLIRDLDSYGRQLFRSILKQLLPAKLIPVCIALTGIPADKLAHQITSEDRKRLRGWLKDFRLKVTGFRPFTEAIVTAGGIDLKEVDPRTMESRLAEGLYFAGEILDLDADTGGYNLQAGFSTGWVAGMAAAQSTI